MSVNYYEVNMNKSWYEVQSPIGITLEYTDVFKEAQKAFSSSIRANLYKIQNGIKKRIQFK